jgi:hypothetical protein
MKIRKLLAAALVMALGAGIANAKIAAPVLDDAAKAKAEEAKLKAADAAKQDAELLAKSQDRVAERYKKGQAKTGKPAPAAKAAKQESPPAK